MATLYNIDNLILVPAGEKGDNQLYSYGGLTSREEDEINSRETERLKQLKGNLSQSSTFLNLLLRNYNLGLKVDIGVTSDYTLTYVDVTRMFIR